MIGRLLHLSLFEDLQDACVYIMDKVGTSVSLYGYLMGMNRCKKLTFDRFHSSEILQLRFLERELLVEAVLTESYKEGSVVTVIETYYLGSTTWSLKERKRITANYISLLFLTEETIWINLRGDSSLERCKDSTKEPKINFDNPDGFNPISGRYESSIQD